MSSPITLGSKVRDQITGMEGVAVCRSDWLHGCTRWGVQPEELHEGKPLEPQFFDEPQLEVIVPEPPKARPTTGGPRREPSSSRPGE